MKTAVRNTLWIFALVLLAAGCATTSAVNKGPDDSRTAETAREASHEPYNGPKTALAVLPVGLSRKAAQRYPHLLDKSVGLGVHNVLSDELYQTGRFRFVEEKESVVEDVFKRQWLSATGAVDRASAVELGRVLGAKKVVYGEVYDYSEGKNETVTGLRVKTEPVVRVGIQIRLVDVETLEYVPASGSASGADWGEASQRAIRKAVLKLVR